VSFYLLFFIFAYKNKIIFCKNLLQLCLNNKF
jgi:hypothetical protein